MANLQKFRAHEALNTTSAGNFSVADASSGGLGGSSGASVQAGSSADVANTKHMDLASDTHQLLIYAAGDIYFNFATSDLDIDADIDLILPGGSLTSIAVPVAIRGRVSNDTIRFNFNSTSTTAHVVRIVEV
tara:strand:- start:35 stop:430 length:396 start_codon:yes stop_codon:yes gene_type:complete